MNSVHHSVNSTMKTLRNKQDATYVKTSQQNRSADGEHNSISPSRAMQPREW